MRETTVGIPLFKMQKKAAQTGGGSSVSRVRQRE